MSKGVKLEHLSIKAQIQAIKIAANDKKDHHRIANTAADVEQVTGKQPLAAKEDTGHGPPCRVHFHSIRKRLADPDGISGKAALDGIVHCSILANDTAKEVKEVRHTQETGKVERTIITLEWD